MDCERKRSKSAEMQGIRVHNTANLEDVFEELKANAPEFLILDLDFTLKLLSDYWQNILKLNLGRMPDSALKVLGEFLDTGNSVCIVTNQPKNGHQIARFLGNLKGYPFFCDSLDDRIKIFGGDWRFCFPGHHFKKTPQAVSIVSELANSNMYNSRKGIIMIGDRDEDRHYAIKLDQYLVGLENGLRVTDFFKLPDPPILPRVPKVLRNLFP